MLTVTYSLAGFAAYAYTSHELETAADVAEWVRGTTDENGAVLSVQGTVTAGELPALRNVARTAGLMLTSSAPCRDAGRDAYAVTFGARALIRA